MSESKQSTRIALLLENARNGDERARDELFECCRNYINVIARTNVETWMKAKVDSSDLVQQTLLEAHRGFRDFEGKSEGEWLAWLKQILAHNTHDFIRRFRAGKRDVKKEVRIQPQSPDASAPFRELAARLDSPSQVLMDHEQEFELANAISRLPDDYREVIQLRNLQRLSFEEVSERMERSRGAVQMLWMRALNKLQEILVENQSDS
ncbi:ECF RNA polymerase sigma-E factor [Thalassoglobus neptunius]|uniref:ECF RNA polymerase sigma-E factor n=1 Tax=Thalassoglobus neptunius TaxID=1938619 RepID=A0A5C5W8H4_9PLAN|nr:sigma-70 family RNA polymerase sigma factor [Thalassoglobus neptunius]TWT47020.1 ECF RNA polymerase sigma-E factor [Thalassoglobus neptunius]